jgi:hexosaminidase
VEETTTDTKLFYPPGKKIVNAGGKKTVGWDEIIKGELAPAATEMSLTGGEGGITAARMQHPVIMTPVEYLYIDAPQGNVRKAQKG